MGLLDSILGGVLGGGTAPSPVQSVLSNILSSQGGVSGLVQKFTQAGYGDHVNSWVGSGDNRPIEPNALQSVFGQGQVNQWAQQSGMQPHDLLGALSQFLPHAVDRMTPNGRVDNAGGSPFDDAGVELPQR